MHEQQQDITHLPVAVPPMLEEALGYDGQGRLVAFYWGAGDEAYYDDGFVSATAEWDAFLTFIEHHTVATALRDYDFGSSEAIYWLVLDREQRRLFAAPKTVARQILQTQWKPPTTEKCVVVDSKAWAQLIQEIDYKISQLTPDIILALMRQHQQLVQELVTWLENSFVQA